jgi:hypothetical protein
MGLFQTLPSKALYSVVMKPQDIYKGPVKGKGKLKQKSKPLSSHRPHALNITSSIISVPKAGTGV